MVGPRAKRRALKAVRGKFKLSVRTACRLLGLQESTYYHRSTRTRSDTELIANMREIVEKKNYYGRPRVTWALRTRYGMPDNHKRIARVYREQGLQIWKRKKSRKIRRPKLLLEVPKRPNELWPWTLFWIVLPAGEDFAC